MKIIVCTFCIVALAAGGWWAYHAVAAGSGESPYITAPVASGPIIATVTATGTVEPTTKVLVGSQVSGTVTRWYADFNAPVRAGQVLVELDQDRFKTALLQRQAAVKVAAARLEGERVRFADATRERQRIEKLYEKKTASENEYLVVQAAEESARAAVQAAEAELESARAEEQAAAVELSKTIITCPIDGVVISRDIDAGQTVAASLQAPTLYTIAADLRVMQVHANLAESDVGRVREGVSVEFTVDAYPDRKFRGKVSQVRYNPTIIDNVVSYVTLIDVDNSELLLRPGMTADITFEVARTDAARKVPNAALRFNPENSPVGAPGRPPSELTDLARNPRVYVLKSGRPVPVDVKIGLTDGSFTEIREGPLEPGAVVIVDRRWSANEARPNRPRGPMGM